MEDSTWNGNVTLCEEAVAVNTSEQEHISLYTVVPISNFTSDSIQSKDNDQELKTLLESWGCLSMYDYLNGENVTVYILKIIKEPHINGLISGFKHGDRILFQHHLEKWRSSIGLPLNIESQPSLSTETLTPSTPSTSAFSSSGWSPGSSPEPVESQTIGLSTILSAKKHGEDIIAYYEKNKKFESVQRQLLINLIAEYFEENTIPLTLKTSYRIENEILDRFPTESLKYYRTEKRGKIYTKLHNIRRVYKPLQPKKKKLSPTQQKKTDIRNLKPEADAEYCIKSLNFDNPSAEEFDSFWVACTQYRLIQIRTFSSQSEIFKAWPQYKNQNGYRLIDKDFNTLYPQGLTICENWEKNFKLMKQFLIQNIKDKKVTEMLTKIEDCDFNKETAILHLLKSLHNYLIPTKPVVSKLTLGNKCQRYTIKDSQQAFIFEGESIQQIEDHLDFLNRQHQNIQPFILAHSKKDSQEEYFVYLNGYKLKFNKLLRAVDICLKIFFVFDLQYPAACEQFWVFIQFFFYSIEPMKKDVTSRLSTIIDTLKD